MQHSAIAFWISIFSRIQNIFACSSHDYCIRGGGDDPLWDRISIYPDKAAFSLLSCIFVFCFVLKLAGFSSLRSFDCSPLASTVKFGTPFPISFPYSFPIHFPFVFLFVCPFQSGPPSGKWITSTAPSDFRLISHHFSFRLFNYYPK